MQAKSGVQEFRSSGVQEFRSSGVQEFSSSGVQEFRSSGVQEFILVNSLLCQAFSGYCRLLKKRRHWSEILVFCAAAVASLLSSCAGNQPVAQPATHKMIGTNGPGY